MCGCVGALRRGRFQKGYNMLQAVCLYGRGWVGVGEWAFEEGCIMLHAVCLYGRGWV